MSQVRSLGEWEPQDSKDQGLLSAASHPPTPEPGCCRGLPERPSDQAIHVFIPLHPQLGCASLSCISTCQQGTPGLCEG